MPTLEERVAYLEGRFGDHDHTMDSLRQDYTRAVAGVHTLLADFRDQMIQGFEQINRRFEQVDKRFEQVDKRFEQIDRRFEQMENRFQGVDGRFVGQDAKIDRHFMWLVGIQIAALVAVVGALVGSYYK